jgi:hypothetical protein
MLLSSSDVILQMFATLPNLFLIQQERPRSGYHQETCKHGGLADGLDRFRKKSYFVLFAYFQLYKSSQPLFPLFS